MATSSRQSAIFGVNDWKAIYQTFREADFRSYDYETLRKSFIDYLRAYYPETFNDYIESSEFIALMDVIAFMGQGIAFRNDLNTRENFIDTAERRDSVIKLANLISYNPKRNIAGQGFIKVTSIRTTEQLIDLNGINLSNQTILWNDPANSNWLEQFNTIINATLINSQKVGRPGNSQELLGVLTSEYAIQIPNNSLPVIPFTSTINTLNMNFELCSVTSVNEDYVYELPPAPTGKFNILYRNDKLGYGSPNTGFFFYFKQGTLQNYDFNLAQQISNQVVDIDIQGINNSDTWLYQLNLNNGDRTLWTEVESVYANAQLSSTVSTKKVFSVVSRFNDQVSYTFGDGVFSEVPVGTYRAYVRAGNALTYSIDPTEMQGIQVTIQYISRAGRTEALTLGLQLTLPATTAQARETLADIKLRAPARYYTQNRMVNGEDYNNFPYTLYSSIIKSKAINRTSVGVSKNLDLLDPTGKYSSTNSFANDGAIYQNSDNGWLVLNFNDTGDIIEFLTDSLANALADNRAKQYYLQNYPRYDINTTTGDGTVYWNTSTVDANSVTGYFYNISGSTNVPIAIGTYSTHNVKYITPGAMIRVIAPSGYYFDQNNRLVTGIAGPSDTTFFWTTILSVIGDGYNNGTGNFSNGTGPVTLNAYVPNGAIINQVIPSFQNTLPSLVLQNAITRIELNQSFSLLFNNSLTISQDRWSIAAYNESGWFVNFESMGNNVYNVYYRALRYYFGSVADTRFFFETGKLVYDPVTGKILSDYVNMLSTNTQPGNNYALTKPVKVNIIGQTIESDGYVNDFEVEVSSIDVNNREIILDPDFFTTVTGYQVNNSNIGIYAFFELIQDAVNLSRYQVIQSSDVAYQYPNLSTIEVVKYEYPLGQLFYAYNETDTNGLYNVFYISVQDNTVTTPYYIMTLQPQYSMQPGRQGLQFQYRHNSNNTTRIDPATTNIIDLYLVTQAYYTEYQNYIQDTTDTVPKPDVPTISELQQAYGKLDDYKMLTDNVIPNSVRFVPLFGHKAAPQLQGTVKVIKSQTINSSDSEVRSATLTAMNNYFNINNWNFGDTFYFSELSAYLHAELGELVSSIVLVPNDPTMNFGDLYEIKSAPYEIFVNGATANDVVVITALTPVQLQIR
jgi:hypothetical protein